MEWRDGPEWLLAALLAALVVVSACDGGGDGAPATPTASPSTTVVAAVSPTTSAPAATTSPTAEPEPAPSAVLRRAGPGASYVRELSFIDGNGDLLLVTDTTGAEPRMLIEGCGGVDFGKFGGVPTAGILWSADGSTVACKRSDGGLSVRRLVADSAVELAPAGSCWTASVSPPGTYVACEQDAIVRVIDVVSGEVMLAESHPGIVGGPGFEWSPSGEHLLFVTYARGQERTALLTLATGRVRMTSIGAISIPGGVAWTLDGRYVGYRTFPGVEVLDLTTDEVVDSEPPRFDANGNGIWWLDETSLLVEGAPEPFVFDGGSLASGDPLQVSGWTYPLASGSRVVTLRDDGIFVEGVPDAVVVQLNAQLEFDGLGLPPVVMNSGDGAWVCWAENGGRHHPARCASIDGAEVVEVVPPLQFDENELALGSTEQVWIALSPDARRIAFTEPGLEAMTSEQRLVVADLDGENRRELGIAVGVVPFAWRPDGVYRYP